MAVDVIVGDGRGDEGKGRFSDMWAERYPIVARYGGGPNAGHTVVMPSGLELKLHGIPSGIGYSDKINVMGDGEFTDASELCAEMDYLIDEKGIDVSPQNLLISSSSHLILPHHIVLDMRRESGGKGQGSTKSGIAYVDADVSLREGVRTEVINNDVDELYERIREGLRPLGRLSRPEMRRLGGKGKIEIAERYVECAKRLGPFVTDTAFFLNQALGEGKDILAEGAQGFLLDKFQGTWPDVTSSITTSGGVSPGLGVSPQSIRKVFGIAKAIPSHVGGGHFVTQAYGPADQHRLHGDPLAPDGERGVTTGRLRRLGHLDIPQLRRANLINGTTEMGLTKLDWLNRYVEVIPICVNHVRKGKDRPIGSNAAYKLWETEPVYTELPGWSEDISDVREFADLPRNAQNYVKFIEDQLEVPITHLGVGMGRDEVIVRDAA